MLYRGTFIRLLRHRRIEDLLVAVLLLELSYLHDTPVTEYVAYLLSVLYGQ